ncbi:zinc finger protein [Trypanosoma rangeli]|uniref:Palmitoyltransferase n=1 Tax=Trypanosoma rangeli TaxID=5698 RepID=A0A422NXW5_TRYRA|nr:zinc finger protein [Trypanosoma rangeli]RNF10271.1 zinc finger protein [Trypanosoma rangeli]|eukprot:RNF10271.1 zinc finger protein [Trypanosoma rangeli]
MYTAHRPSGLCGWCVFFCRCLPPVLAVGLILANVIPYYVLFLPRLHKTYMKGEISWIYCAYCHVVMLVAEVLVFVNFFLAISTSPGYVERVPWANMPVFKGRVNSDNMNEVHRVGIDGKLRYCSKCEIYKPDTAHHCRTCRRCVYHMDHHCPWINNCVGRDNAKFFMLFLAYIPLGGLHIGATTAYSCAYHFDVYQSSELLSTSALIFSAVFSLVMGISFLMFAAHFLWMMLHGETTIGNMVYRRAGDERYLKEERERYLKDIFGEDHRWWRLICPFRAARPSHKASLQGLL